MKKAEKKYRWLWLAGVLALVVAGVLIVPKVLRPGGGGLPTGVTVGTAEVATLTKQVEASGIVSSQVGTQVKIGSQVSGRIRELPADVGSIVKAGQVVAIIDATDMEAQVEMQRHAVARAEASLAQSQARLIQAEASAGYTDQGDASTDPGVIQAQAALATAQSSLQKTEISAAQEVEQAKANLADAKASAESAESLSRRKQALADRGSISQQEAEDALTAATQAAARLTSAEAALVIATEKAQADVDNAKNVLTQSEAGLESAMRSSRIKDISVAEAQSSVSEAQANLSQAQAQLEYQLAQLEKTVIRSPIDGTVLSITAQQGETVAAGLSAPTLITVADLTRLEIRAYIDETDIALVELGLPAEIRVDAFYDTVYTGEVSKIASASTIQDNVVTYETTIAIDDFEGRLRPDMTAECTLTIGTFPNVLTVPSEALHREVSGDVVYVYQSAATGRERLITRQVTAGFDDGFNTEITSGLEEGETVVLSGASRLMAPGPPRRLR